MVKIRAMSMAVVLCSLSLTAHAADTETRICTPHVPAETLATYTPSVALQTVTAQLLPRLQDGTPVAWGTPGALLIIAVAGPSTMAQIAGPFGSRLHQLAPAQVKVVKATAYGVASREWADPADPSWVKGQAAVEKIGTVQQVVIWIHQHTVTEWATRGQMTAAMVTATMASAKARYPSIALFLHVDHPYTGYAYRVTTTGALGAAGVSVEGIAYEAGEITRHPSMREIAHDGSILADIASTQIGVPNGAYAEYHQIATQATVDASGQVVAPELCGRYDPDDGVHVTPKTDPLSGAVYYGTALAEWLSAWPPFRDALPAGGARRR